MSPDSAGTAGTRHPFFIGLLSLATVTFSALLVGPALATAR